MMNPWHSRLIIAAVLAIPTSPAVAEVKLPSGGTIEKVDFERHVMGLFSKAGCNNGSCHGSFQGKNGFRLSLFALEPDRDFAAITRDLQGRRIDFVNPDASLLLTKGSGQIRHDGGARFSKGAWQYEIIREWIRQGAPRSKGSGDVVDIELTPKEYVFVQPAKPTNLKVVAKFADGSTEDVTPFCDFRVQDDAVARVGYLGDVTAVKPGDSGLAVLYRGKVASARILVPTESRTEVAYPKPVNFIDREVYAKLQLLKLEPSGLANDTEFLRRVTIDTTGSLPTPAEVRAFLADSSPDKRARKIDELLQSPRHAALWATKFSDITGNNTQALENPPDMQVRRSQMWHDWLRSRFERNMPYDEIAKGILTATSLDGKKPEEWIEHVRKVDEQAAKFDTSEYSNRDSLDLFWRRQAQVPAIEWGEKVAAAFMGVRLECAQCHKHPTDRWTQADYRAFANLFTGVVSQNNQFSSTDVKKIADAENAERNKANMAKNNAQRNIVREMFVSAEPRRQAMLTHPDTGAILNPKAPAGPEFKTDKGKDVRAQLHEWLRSSDNPFFARSFVNRVWAHYFGVGLVDPVDDFSQANPPTNARLLDALARDFVESKFDIRKLERQILLTRTYQTSSTPNASNKFDKVNYARSYVRPMLAEVVVDILNDALGTTENFQVGAGNDAGSKLLDGRRTIEIGSSRLNNPNLAYALRIFGRPPRTTACDCERAMEPALPQTLFRMTDASIIQKLSLQTNRPRTLAKDTNRTDDQLFEELFLATLSRLPSAEELETFKKHRAASSDRATAFVDAAWALINTREFVLNH